MHNLLWAMADLYDYITILITWLFVFAFLYNLSTAINKSDNSRTQLSLIMMVSYTLSLFIDMSTLLLFLKLFAFDVVTIAVIFIWRLCLGKVIPIGFYYLIVGLCINASLFMAMHIDMIVNPTHEFWWLWMLYSFSAPIVDFIMALVLIANKDILGLVKLKSVVLNRKTPMAR